MAAVGLKRAKAFAEVFLKKSRLRFAAAAAAAAAADSEDALAVRLV